MVKVKDPTHIMLHLSTKHRFENNFFCVLQTMTNLRCSYTAGGWTNQAALIGEAMDALREMRDLTLKDLGAPNDH